MICDKITVVKTFMLSVLSHVATVLPTPPNSYCKKSEKIMSDYIKGEREQSETDDTVKFKANIVSHKTWMAQKIRKRNILENSPY